jgi:hypothetical protein
VAYRCYAFIFWCALSQQAIVARSGAARNEVIVVGSRLIPVPL